MKLTRLSFPTDLSDAFTSIASRTLTFLLCATIAIAGFSLDTSASMPVALADNYEKATLFDEDLSERDLTDSNFTLATLRKCSLQDASLIGVRLFRTKFMEVNLEGADLRYATLDSALFSKSSLNNAVLEGAFAYGARFEGTSIDGADFTDVLLREDAIETLCKIATGTNPTTGLETRATLMCDYY